MVPRGRARWSARASRAAADRRRHDQPDPHRGEDHARTTSAGRPSTSRTPAAPSAWSRACCRPTTRPGYRRARARGVRQGRARPTPRRDATSSACRWRAARANRFTLDWSAYTPPAPTFLGARAFDELRARRARAATSTGRRSSRPGSCRAATPRSSRTTVRGEAARQLFDDAQAMLERIVAEQWFAADGRRRLLAGQRRRRRHRALRRRRRATRRSPTLHTLRQQLRRATASANMALADFVAPRDERRWPTTSAASW